MSNPPRSRSKAASVALWLGSILIALGMGLAGMTKFTSPARWDTLFVGWGYPAWFSALTGVLEMVGAVTLLIPAVAFYSAMLLIVIMCGALVTLLTHPGGAMGWGATPTVYIIILAAIGWSRWSDRRVARTAPGVSP